MSKQQLETRHLQVSTCQLRAMDPEASTPPIIEGLAIAYNSPSKLMFDYWRDIEFREIILPSAVVYGDDVTASLDHDNHNKFIGRRNVNITFIDKSDGLYYEIELPDTQLGRDIRALGEAGLLTGTSFEFKVVDEEIDKNEEDEVYTRTISKLELHAINPLASVQPAYDASKVQCRSLNDFLNKQDLPTGSVKMNW